MDRTFRLTLCFACLVSLAWLGVASADGDPHAEMAAALAAQADLQPPPLVLPAAAAPRHAAAASAVKRGTGSRAAGDVERTAASAADAANRASQHAQAQALAHQAQAAAAAAAGQAQSQAAKQRAMHPHPR